jgi:hypothetical protein
MVSVLASSEVDRGFIGGVMVSVLACSEVDRGFIGGVMVSMIASRSTTLEASTLTLTPPMIYNTRGKHANHYTTNDLPHSRRAR